MMTRPLRLPHLDALWLSGTDTVGFLDRQLTVPASSLEPGAGRLACWCDPKGRVIASLWLVRTAADEYCAFLAAALASAVRQRMGLYVLRDDVTLQGISTSDCIAGTDADGAADWPALAWRPEARLMVSEDASAARDDAGAAAWRHGDIERGLPWLDEATTGRFLPQTLGMDTWGAVDYNKGCYPGQEVISRTHYLGRIKRRLWRVRIDAAADGGPGSEIMDAAGNACGTLLDTAPVDHSIAALAVLHDSCAEEVLSLPGDAGNARVQVEHRIEAGTTSE